MAGKFYTHYSKLFLVLVPVLIVTYLFSLSDDWSFSKESQKDFHTDKQTRIDEAFKQDFERTKDLSLGYPPSERLFEAYKVIKRKNLESLTKSGLEDINWTDRGPARIGGRTRSILISRLDPTRETVFTAGVAGGIWKTTNISNENPRWENLSDNFENLAVTSIVQDPDNPQIMYFSTGEGYGNFDSVRGLGIWKSTDGGDTWSQLLSTNNSTFYYTQRMIVVPGGDVYACTQQGLMRSQNQGLDWEKVLGTGISNGNSNRINDIELAIDGSLYVVVGYNATNARVFKSNSGPNLGNIGAWELRSGGLPPTASRIEIAATGSSADMLYALVAIGGQAQRCYVTNDGGNNWSQVNFPTTANGGNALDGGSQGWYDLMIDVDPNNPDRVIIGAVVVYMSANGGLTWQNINRMHVDHHYVLWDEEDSNRVFFGNDGGIYMAINATGPPINLDVRNKNLGYNVTQFYACAIHPDEYSNYFLAGSQDNGTQQFSQPGFGLTRPAFGADGAFTHIDQDEPEKQIVSWQFGNYLRSENGGNSFDTWFTTNIGFINVSDYDNLGNHIYAFNGQGSFIRGNMDDPSSGGVEVSFQSGVISPNAITASPNVANRIYFGTNRVYRVDNAHQGTSVQEEDISSFLNGIISCIEIEKGNEDHMLVTFFNYGSVSVRETRDGGATWENVEGDLPDMPVRWALFHPEDADKALIATETGVWSTEDLDGANTVWTPHPAFPNTRTDMMKWRESDNLIIAATHGRGLWSTDAFSPPRAFINIIQAGYLDTEYQFNDVSVNPSEILWEFGDGSTSTDRNTTHSYDEIGNYDVSITINGGVDVAAEELTILPDRDVPYTLESSGPYGGDFESTTEDFATYHISGSRFERGSSSINGKNGTNSGSNAWVLAPNDAQYENFTETMLYTPNYDLSAEGIYEFSFWSKHLISLGFDGFRVEYSLDRGLSWLPLGREQDRWYNFTNDEAEDAAFPPGASFFTGSSGSDWKNYKLNINNLQGNADVAFRFVFASNGINSAPGVAIDDIEIKAVTEDLETQIIDFTGEHISFEEVKLDWVTQPEFRSDFFEVQHSENGRDWDVEGTFDGIVYSVDPVAYTTELDNIKLPVNYFRIRGVNQDGSEIFSKILVLTREEVEPDIYLLYPNPFTTDIQIAFNQEINEDILIRVYDEIGREVVNKTVNPSGILTTINASWLSPGTYFLHTEIGDTRIVKKVLKLD
ncbi:MAG: T9SS type A sorting domain-containing protein [Bacteroidota bacterium]